MSTMRIVIDGNIGSGKTTQLDALRGLGYKIKKEPIEKWPLELFYSDPGRWGFLFQMIVLQTFEVDGGEDGCTIYERCPSSSRDVFWSVMDKNPVEDQAYQYEFNRHAWFPDVYILIDKSPELCHEHMKLRKQDGDSMVSLEYLQRLDTQYSIMFDQIQCPKYRVDGDATVDKVLEDIKAIIKRYIPQ